MNIQNYAHQVDDLILFDGNALNEAVPGVKIVNITIGAADIESVSYKRVKKAGSDFSYKRNDVRIIRIIVELPLDRISYAENVRALRAWAESEEPKPLCLPAYPDDQIYVTLTAFSEFAQREWWLPVELEFTAWDTCFENVRERVSDVGKAFSIGGSGDPIIRVVHAVTGELNDPEWVFDGGKRIKILGTISAGVIEIDLNHMNVTHDGVPVKLAITSRFPLIKPGVHTVSGPDGGQVRWKERWL